MLIRSDQFSRIDPHISVASPTFSSSTPSSLLLPLPTSSETILPSKRYSPIGPLGWVGGPQESDTQSGPVERGRGGGWEAGGAAAVVMSCGGVRVQPAEVQAARVREYVVHGSRRRNRKLRDSPLNSRFPSLYRWYICKKTCVVLTVAACSLYPCPVWKVVIFDSWLRTVMMPLGVLGWSQLSSNALPCSLCSTVKPVRCAGEASKVQMSTHGLDTLPERLHKSNKTAHWWHPYHENSFQNTVEIQNKFRVWFHGLAEFDPWLQYGLSFHPAVSSLSCIL